MGPTSATYELKLHDGGGLGKLGDTYFFVCQYLYVLGCFYTVVEVTMRKKIKIGPSYHTDVNTDHPKSQG